MKISETTKAFHANRVPCLTFSLDLSKIYQVDSRFSFKILSKGKFLSLKK